MPIRQKMNYLYIINVSKLSWLAIKSQKCILPEIMQNRIDEFRFERDKCFALLGKILLLYILKKHENYPANILPYFKYNDHKKPEIAVMKGKFNISHSGDWVICGYNTQGDIGVDIEKITPINISDYQEIFTNKEYQRAINTTTFDFFQLWTLKEAIIKADGRGFFLPPNSFDIPFPFENYIQINVDQKNWFLYSELINENHYLSIASATTLQNNLQLKQLFFNDEWLLRCER